MKIGWLVWRYECDDTPQLYTVEPDSWYHKVVQIVYAEIIQ